MHSNQMNLICYITHLQISVILKHSHETEFSFVLFNYFQKIISGTRIPFSLTYFLCSQLTLIIKLPSFFPHEINYQNLRISSNFRIISYVSCQRKSGKCCSYPFFHRKEVSHQSSSNPLGLI